MGKIVAKFEKVSLEQFKEAVKNCGNILGENVDAIYKNIETPKRGTKGSAGYDFYAPFDFELKPGETMTIPTGIRCKIDDGWFLMCVPRSGLGFKFKMQLYNTIGIIDSDYYGADNEGHIMLKIYNDSPEGKTVAVKQGNGMMQGILIPYGITEDDAAGTERTGGFGSTTK